MLVDAGSMRLEGVNGVAYKVSVHYCTRCGCFVDSTVTVEHQLFHASIDILRKKED